MRSIKVVRVLCLALAGQLLMTAADDYPWRYWNISRLQAGRELTVETFPPERVVRGMFIARDEDGITVRAKDGTSQTIARTSIRKVTAKRKAYDYAPLIGAAAGATVTGIVASRPKWDYTRSAIAWQTATGGGIGALIGWAVRAAANDEVIYQASKR